MDDARPATTEEQPAVSPAKPSGKGKGKRGAPASSSPSPARRRKAATATDAPPAAAAVDDAPSSEQGELGTVWVSESLTVQVHCRVQFLRTGSPSVQDLSIDCRRVVGTLLRGSLDERLPYPGLAIVACNVKAMLDHE